MSRRNATVCWGTRSALPDPAPASASSSGACPSPCPRPSACSASSARRFHRSRLCSRSRILTCAALSRRCLSNDLAFHASRDFLNNLARRLLALLNSSIGSTPLSGSRMKGDPRSLGNFSRDFQPPHQLNGGWCKARLIGWHQSVPKKYSPQGTLGKGLPQTVEYLSSHSSWFRPRRWKMGCTWAGMASRWSSRTARPVQSTSAR